VKRYVELAPSSPLDALDCGEDNLLRRFRDNLLATVSAPSR
jgi:hypothetical protein